MSYSLKVLYVSIIISFIYLGFFSTKVSAQFTRTSYPYFTQQFLHTFTINPAFVGDPDQPSVGLGYRAAPRFGSTPGRRGPIDSRSSFVYIKGVVPALNDGGVGLSFSSNSDTYTIGNIEEEFYDRQFFLGLSAAYTFNLADLIDLKGGASVGYLRSKTNNYFNATSITPNNEQRQKLNIDIGIMIDIPFVRFGVAMHHNNQPEFDFYPGASKVRYQNEFFITIDGDIPIQDIVNIKPSIIAQMEQRDMLTQYTLMGEYNDMVFLGVSYSTALSFNRNINTTTGVMVRGAEQYHPLQFTLGGKVADFMFAGTYGLTSRQNTNALFEFSVGYFFSEYQ